MSLWPSKTKMWQAKTRVTSVPVKKTNNGIRYSEEIVDRSEEHTSELQSRSDLVCRLLLEKKKKKRVIQSSGRMQDRQGEAQCHLLCGYVPEQCDAEYSSDSSSQAQTQDSKHGGEDRERIV